MKPCILDLRSEGCPMALLRAKRFSRQHTGHPLIIYVTDNSSKRDIIRYFDKQNFRVQVDEQNMYSSLTVYTQESPNEC